MAKQFIRLPYRLAHGPTWKSLSRASRDLYLQIQGSRFLPDGHGHRINTDPSFIEFGHSDSWGMSKSTFTRCVMELRKKGLIRVVRPGLFPRIKYAFELVDKWEEYEKNAESL